MCSFYKIDKVPVIKQLKGYNKNLKGQNKNLVNKNED